MGESREEGPIADAAARFKHEEARYFDDHLEAYVERFCAGRWLAYKTFVERVASRRLASATAGLRVLDVGAGPSPAFGTLAGSCRSYVCTDLAAKPLQYLRAHHPGCEVLRCDADRLPFANHAFDLVVDFGLLHHLPDASIAAREMRRVLRPGGLVVASEPGEQWSGRDCRDAALASPNEQGLTETQLRRLFDGFEITMSSFNHRLPENLTTRLTRAFPALQDANGPLWNALFACERLLHAIGIRGGDHLLIGRLPE
jgi:SAM-dependent methyltransferase